MVLILNVFFVFFTPRFKPTRSSNSSQVSPAFPAAPRFMVQFDKYKTKNKISQSSVFQQGSEHEMLEIRINRECILKNVKLMVLVVLKSHLRAPTYRK